MKNTATEDAGKYAEWVNKAFAVFRIDWTRDDCAPARSADPAQAAQCPNL